MNLLPVPKTPGCLPFSALVDVAHSHQHPRETAPREISLSVLLQGLGFERTAALDGEAVRDALILALTSAIDGPSDCSVDKGEFLISDGDLLVFDNTRLFHAVTEHQDPVLHLIHVGVHQREPVDALRLVA